MRRFLLASIPVAPIALAIGACGQGGPASIGLVMKAPQGLLSDAESVKLTVFDAGQSKCGSTGHVEVPSGEGVQSFDLEKSGCASGATWCKDIELDQDGSTKMFAVVAKNATGTIAEGCATATIDQDPVEVTIKVQRYVAPSCCNDGVVQVGELCDLGAQSSTDCSGGAGGACKGIPADDVCTCDCQAQEVPIDHVASAPLPVAGTKSQLAMAFSPGNTKINDGLRAVFTDKSSGANGGTDVQLRVMQKDLYPVPVEVSAPLSNALRLPLLCTAVAGQGAVRTQEAAAIAPISSTAIAVVYASDEKVAGRFDVLLSAQGPDGCADLAPVQLNTTLEDSTAPDVAAGPTGSGLVVWVRGGRIIGRIWKTTGELYPAAAELDFGPGSQARVAGNDKGWVVAYAGAGSNDGDGVFTKSVDPAGAIGAEVKVNAVTDGVQDQVDVALHGDRTIVVWHSGGDVYFQRFDASHNPVSGDQSEPIHKDTNGEQSNPTVASGNALGDFFVVAWEEIDKGGIGARYVGGDTGFAYNNITGQNDDFPAENQGVHFGVAGSRRLPAIAIGGAGYIAIGWQDELPDHAGIYVRRFPLPQ